eukprot:scaffold2927_cov143-Cylindrotheca_fusiformis.AAC.2
MGCNRHVADKADSYRIAATTRNIANVGYLTFMTRLLEGSPWSTKLVDVGRTSVHNTTSTERESFWRFVATTHHIFKIAELRHLSNLVKTAHKKPKQTEGISRLPSKF